MSQNLIQDTRDAKYIPEAGINMVIEFILIDFLIS